MRRQNPLAIKAREGLNLIDEAVLECLTLSDKPLLPSQISNRLRIPESYERTIRKNEGKKNAGISYPTVRDSLYRLLHERKVRRIKIPMKNNREYDKWDIHRN